jgi:hypothetical protein
MSRLARSGAVLTVTSLNGPFLVVIVLEVSVILGDSQVRRRDGARF